MTAYDDNPHATGHFVNIAATAGGPAYRTRRSRAARIGAHRRRYQREHGVTLTLVSRNYSETPGFLSRTTVRYRIERQS